MKRRSGDMRFRPSIGADSEETLAISASRSVTGAHRILPGTPKDAFWLSFGLCVSICGLILYGLAPITGMSQFFGTDAHDGYLEIGRNLIQGHGFVFEPGGVPVSHRPPLYPFILMPITLLSETFQRPAVIVLHSLMVGGIGALIFRMAAHLFTLTVAKCAMVLFLLNPWLYLNAKNPMTPILQGLLYVTFICLLGREVLFTLNDATPQKRNSTLLSWLLIGAAGGLLSLTHGAMIAVNAAFLFTCFVLALVKHHAALARRVVLAGLITIVLIAPWTYRNWVVFHEFIPVVGGSGLMYFYGDPSWNEKADTPSQGVTGSRQQPAHDTSEVIKSNKHFHGFTDYKVDRTLTKHMVDHIISHPVEFSKRITLNAIGYYFPTLSDFFRHYIPDQGNLIKLALSIFHLMLWLLSGIGIWHVKQNRVMFFHTKLLLLAIVLYAIWYFPFLTSMPHTLYTFSTIPILAILASLGSVYSLCRLWSISGD